MKKMTLLFSFILFARLISAQNDTAYIYTYGGAENEKLFQIKEAPGNTFISVGYTGSYGYGNSDIYLLKTDSAGHKIWSKYIGDSGVEWGYSVVVTSDSGFAIAGYTGSAGAGGYDVLLVKTDSLGEVLWQKTFGGTDWDFGYSIKETADGGLLIAGKTYSYGAGGADAYIIKTDNSGNSVFEKTYGGEGEDVANDIIIDSDGNYVFIGETSSMGNGKADLLLQKINSYGDEIWTKAFGDSLNEVGYSLVQTQDLGYAMAGYCESYTAEGDKEIFNIKADYSGAFSWQQVYGNATLPDEAKVVAELPSGELLYSGYTSNGAGGTDVFAYLATAGGWWTPASASYGATKDEMVFSAVYASNKSFYMAGYTETPLWSSGLADAMVIVSDSIKSDPIQLLALYDDFLLSEEENALFAKHLTIYPNPFSGSTSVFFPAEINPADIQLDIFDATGRMMIIDQAVNNNRIDLSLQNVSSGIYFISVYSKQNSLLGTGKLIVQ
ncbi:MAG: T9SS type A sorting domain-containing protein [Bacteroidia bacterium]